MNKEGIKELLAEHPELKSRLFARGFLLTDEEVDLDAHPFYGMWKKTSFSNYNIITAEGMRCYTADDGDVSAAIVGHAYNPFTDEYLEDAVLYELLGALKSGEDAFRDAFNELTGVFFFFFIREGSLYVAGDASGMLTVFYTLLKGKRLVSSHAGMIADLLALEKDAYVNELTGYRFFGLLGNSLPGDLSPYREVKRLVPNHYVCMTSEGEVRINRFYWPTVLDIAGDQITERVSELMQHNMRLIAKKWKRPAISLTGGCDSKTTLACAHEIYDKFLYFSYVSSEAEAVDAKAAETICKAIDREHRTYYIPDTDAEVRNAAEVREILRWNTGDTGYSNPNDVRKRIFFAETDDFDVEVKSWASEIGRSYYSKRFNGRTEFGPEPTPRKCTTLYKFFLHNRRLVKETDEVFRRYLNDFFQQSPVRPLEWQDQFFWEFRVPSWNGNVITGEHRYSFDITIPYNNRRILELLTSAPIQDRIHDSIYRDIRKSLDSRIDATGVAVTNLKHTKNREIAENLYYMIHSGFPF